MIINFRYHVFTITAIFAALGLGILIGSSIVGNDVLLEEQKRIVKNISDDITRLQNENNELLEGVHSLKKELSYKKNIEEELYPLLLKDVMKNKKFFLLYNNVPQERVEELNYYFQLMEAEYDIMNYKLLQLDFNYESYNQVVAWNIDKSLDNLKNHIDLESVSFINYYEEDVQGLIFSIIKDVIAND